VPKAEAIAAAPAKARHSSTGRSSCQDGRRGEKGGRKSAARDGVADGVAAQAAGAQARADAELAYADKVLAAARTDEAKRGRERKQKAAAKAAELGTQLDSARADAKPKLDAPPPQRTPSRRPDEEGGHCKVAREASLALEPASIFISRATQKLYVRRNTHKRRRTGRRGVRFLHRRFRSRSAIPTSRSARMYSRGGAQRRGLRGPRSRSTTPTAPGMRSTHHFPLEVLDRIAPTGFATLLDRHLGRAAERRDNYRTSSSRC